MLSGGYRKLSDAARETGEDVNHERLAFEDNSAITVNEPGYVFIWLSNENATPLEVTLRLNIGKIDWTNVIYQVSPRSQPPDTAFNPTVGKTDGY